MPGCRSTCRMLSSLSWGVLAAAAFGWPAPATAAEGVLVLRNGNVLAGSVSLAGGHYRVESEGASLQVPVEQVEAACRSLEEAYELRRRDRVGSTADSHLELARWCLRHDLLDQAAREILDAGTIDGGNPLLAALDLQLRQRLELRASREADREQNDAASGAPTVEESHAIQPHNLDPSLEAQEQFVRSIQPMLVHGCATGGCHQPGSRQQMQLDRWALEGRGNAALIRRNLAAVLRQINKDDPPSSRLMQWARQPHGVGRQVATPLATYQAALLLEWLNQAAGVAPDRAMEGGAPHEATLNDSAVAQAAAPPSFDPDLLNAAKERLAPRPFAPRDAFDPEIFNRRYGPRRVDDVDRRPESIEMTPDFSRAATAPTGLTEQVSAE
jgi:hypothetical protein